MNDITVVTLSYLKIAVDRWVEMNKNDCVQIVGNDTLSVK